MKITADQTRELLQLLVEVDGQSKAAAKQVFNGITPDGRLALLHDLRRRKLLAKPAPAQQLVKGEEEGEKVRAGKAKKVPYTLLMPPDQLEALRNLAEKDDTSVSHHIRQAVRAYLRTRLV
ncbi:ribbon-helix-helix protein, CopG family [Pseudomonas aeruginosa]|uniref:ribbon-helix-helix protein, CopG family n=1 Tax=Pseudomonas aeruginosa TaxID=287 RepID=UPI001F29EC65|nr:ribbon-helix-helix protein, CopG family [Pseudomonas aeruginosa]UJB96719.1 ribbon-helix-helix protein, CopG family [Pseudomonas aeruginosa]UJB96722.1 ribbon-helix-helix protein, CopG family [Pseudomonas aeruginosa]UJB96725.1 ribbon-helix-helix protein, CopG family [Pseudomonas aeruginosa]UJB96728.1 ribbon-helix-helix protein, CopG family [Pseudomonas aeruginosa]UJB96731.1 ribbon-helix-helix protein, CopG family [Pseudomonas aeruginosa]